MVKQPSKELRAGGGVWPAFLVVFRPLAAVLVRSLLRRSSPLSTLAAMRTHTALALWLSLFACGSPSKDPSTAPAAPTEAPLPPPRFAAQENTFGPLRLGMSRREAAAALPLSLRLVHAPPHPWLAGQSLSVTDDGDKPLFLVGFVDDQLAWMLAEDPASGVNTESGVGVGSTVGFAERLLRKPQPARLPESAGNFFSFESLPGVYFKAESQSPEQKISALLVLWREFLPEEPVSLRGVVLPENRIGFLQNGIYHEATVTARAQLPPVGAMVEGEGSRTKDGTISLQKSFAVDTRAPGLPSALQERLSNDPDLLAFAALLATRERVTEYKLEPWPGNSTDTALLVVRRPQGEGFSRVRLIGPDGPVEILPPRFGVARERYIEDP